MSQAHGLLHAIELNGQGGGREINWPEIRDWRREAAKSTCWIHLDRTAPGTRQWLLKESGLDQLVCEALLADETRPRTLAAGGGLLTILRGVNLNPGSDPEDMVSIRAWIEPGRVITLRGRRAMAAQDIRESLAAGHGPIDAADFLVHLAARLIDRMGPVLSELDEAVDAAEEEVLDAQSHELRLRLGRLRRESIALRRYIAPQRDAIIRLHLEPIPWIGELQRARLREIGDRVTRYVEDLDALRERAAVVQEELSVRLAEQMNRTMYILSLVAAIFLPLGFLTGLLGVNVGGIPGTGDENSWAFTLLCVLLAGLAMLQVWWFRRRRMLLGSFDRP